MLVICVIENRIENRGMINICRWYRQTNQHQVRALYETFTLENRE